MKGSMQETVCLDALIDKMLRRERSSAYPDTCEYIAKTVNYALSLPMVTANYVMERREKIKGYQGILEELLKKPKIEQRTKEWYEMRAGMITASDLGQALGEGKFGTVQDVYKKKCGYEPEPEAGFSHYIPPLKWGCMFEPVATDIYMKRYDTYVHEFGVLQHPTVKHFGASPDGITDQGIMLEIKCPFKRKITGEIPSQYYYQIQGQLDVCGLKECDYLECGFSMYNMSQDFYEDKTYPYEKGIIIEYTRDDVENNGKPCYLYSPIYGYKTQEVFGEIKDIFVHPSERDAIYLEETKTAFKKWVDDEIDALCDDPHVDRFSIRPQYWKLEVLNVVRVYLDEEFIKTKLDELSLVWDKVQDYKADKELYITEVCTKKPRMTKARLAELAATTSTEKKEIEEPKEMKKPVIFLEDED